MALFNVPKRTINDSAIIQKTKSKVKSVRVSKGNDLVSRINEIKAQVETKLGKYAYDYIIISDPIQLNDYFESAEYEGVIAIDTETTGLNPLVDEIVGFSIYTPDRLAAYVPINHKSYITGERVKDQISMEDAKVFFELIAYGDCDVIMYNANFDIRVIRNQLGVKNMRCTWDCYLAARCLNENEESNKLKMLHRKYVLHGKEDAFTFDNLFSDITFDMIPIKIGYIYAARDALVTYELYQYQYPYLTETEKRCKKQHLEDVAWVFHNIEMPCVNVVCDMEDTGIKFDFEYNQKLKDKYHKLLAERVNQFNHICDMYADEIEDYRRKMGINCKLEYPINIKSPTQLAILLYDIMKCEVPVDKRTKQEKRTTNTATLIELNNPVAKAILDYREFSTIVDTFIDKLPECVEADGRIHCNFNQYGAKTGRFSSENPNMQNIPSHNKDIRKMFVASDGYVLMSSDYSQQEPKVMTQMCGDKKMIKAYQEGRDLYSEIAALALNTTYEECLEHFPKGTPIKEVSGKWYYATKDDFDKLADGKDDVYNDGKYRRDQAKSILLGVLYGRGVPSIAEQLGVTIKKAQAIKDSVFKGFPAIPKFEKDSLKMAQELGYVTTLWGRKRRLPDLQLEEYEFTWKDGAPPDDDLLDFDDMNTPDVVDVPDDRKQYYLKKLKGCWGSQKRSIFEEANAEGIWIVDNGAKIADAQRQCVNSRIQGSAADMTKLAMIMINEDEKLRKWGFRLLIPVHDELIGECPEENAKKCAKRFAKLMSQVAESRLDIPIKCDVEVTKAWYGEKISL